MCKFFYTFVAKSAKLAVLVPLAQTLSAGLRLLIGIITWLLPGHYLVNTYHTTILKQQIKQQYYE